MIPHPVAPGPNPERNPVRSNASFPKARPALLVALVLVLAACSSSGDGGPISLQPAPIDTLTV